MEHGREVDVGCELKSIPGAPIPYMCLVSRTATPAILQTCQESRYLGLYQQAFSDITTKGADNEASVRRYIWINWDLDTIKLRPWVFGMANITSQSDWASIRYLHLPRCAFYGCSAGSYLKSCLSLRRVTVSVLSIEHSWRQAFPGCPIRLIKEFAPGTDPDECLVKNWDGTVIGVAVKMVYSVEIVPSFYQG